MSYSSRRVFRSLSLFAGLGGLMLILLTVMDYGDSGSIGVRSAEDIDTLRQFDSYLLEPRGTTYRDNGEVAYHWQATRANRMRHGEVLLYEPIYKGLKEGDQNWTATARKGNLSPDGQILILEQDVLVKDFIHQALIRSPRLTLNMAENLIETQDPVRFTSPNAVTTATGMRAAMDEERLEFMSEVRGVYEKP